MRGQVELAGMNEERTEHDKTADSQLCLSTLVHMPNHLQRLSTYVSYFVYMRTSSGKYDYAYEEVYESKVVSCFVILVLSSIVSATSN